MSRQTRPTRVRKDASSTRHTPVLPGMGVTSYLRSLPRGLAVVILAQLDAQGRRQFHRILPASLKQAAVGWISHSLFHNGRVNDDLLETLRETLINSANEMKHEVYGTQQPRPINLIGEGASTAQRSDSLV